MRFYVHHGERRVVRHTNTILMYARTCWPKEAESAQGIEKQYQSLLNWHALLLHSIGHSQQPFAVYCELFNALYTKFRQINQPHFTAGDQIQ